MTLQKAILRLLPECHLAALGARIRLFRATVEAVSVCMRCCRRGCYEGVAHVRGSSKRQWLKNAIIASERAVSAGLGNVCDSCEGLRT